MSRVLVTVTCPHRSPLPLVKAGFEAVSKPQLLLWGLTACPLPPGAAYPTDPFQRYPERIPEAAMGEKPLENEALATYIAVIDGHSRRTWGAWRPRGARQSLWRDRRF